MLKPEEWMDIGLLHREGHSIKQIARMTGRSRNTIRKIVKQKVPRRTPAARRASKLDNYKDYVKERFKSCGLSAVRLLEEIRAMGYTGSVIVLRRYVRSLRPRRERAASSQSATRRHRGNRPKRIGRIAVASPIQPPS